MDLQRIASFLDIPVAQAATRASTLALVGLLTLGLSGCASTQQPGPALDQPGAVLDANNAVHCPHGTTFAAGQTQGRLSTVWCEKPDGKRHGPYIEWWENHQKKAAGYYQDGLRQGTWTFFLDNGQRESQIEYKNGEALTAPPH